MASTGSTPETLDPWDAITTTTSSRRRGKSRPVQGRKARIAGLAVAAAVLVSGIGTGATWVCLEVARHDAGNALQKAVSAAQPLVDLAPKMVTALRNDAPLEQPIITDVVMARNGIAVYDPGANGSGETFVKYAEAESAASTSLAQLVDKAHSHPKLAASQDFTALVQQLDGLTPGIDQANTDYNAAAHRYNSFRDSFPGNLIAPLLGHGEAFGYLDGP